MPLASSGARAFLGRASQFTPAGGGPTGARAIHIPSHAPARSAAQTLFSHTRSLLSRFVGHLTTPGLGSVAPARSFHAQPVQRTIQQGLSLPVRYALSRPMGAPHLPKPPTIPRSTTQVGLGLARNFSTARPVFQSLAENVPVAARSFCEADWDMQLQKERAQRMKKLAKGKQTKKTRQVQQPRPSKVVKPAVVAETSEELDHYFPSRPTPEVTTHLLIPLAPTPTARVPLNPSASPAHPLIPLETIAVMHASHGTHALRVSSLFARLDAAGVFGQPGVHCVSRGDPRGLCTLLEVQFEGWTAARVRGVLGEAGSGWCVLEEVHAGEADAEEARMEAALEEMSAASDISLDTVSSPRSHGAAEIDPAASFVMPTLDFSASFQMSDPGWSTPASAAMSVVATPASQLDFRDVWASGPVTHAPLSPHYDFNDFDDAGTDASWELASVAPTGSLVGFSSQFSGLIQSERHI